MKNKREILQLNLELLHILLKHNITLKNYIELKIKWKIKIDFLVYLHVKINLLDTNSRVILDKDYINASYINTSINKDTKIIAT